MVIIIKTLFFITSIIVAQFSNEKLYVNIQMMDQVGIIDTENYQYDFTIEIEIQNNNIYKSTILSILKSNPPPIKFKKTTNSCYKQKGTR